MKTKKLYTLLLILVAVTAKSQVSINTTGNLPSSTAMLDITSTTKGLLIPRMSTSDRMAIVGPAKGLTVFDITLNKFFYYDASIPMWTMLSTGTNWSLTGNAGTNPTTHFIGTIDRAHLSFWTDSVERMRISSSGNIGIGTTVPDASAQLDVSSTTQGFLPPRMDSTARNAIFSPAAGLTIYNTTINAFQVYNGTNWYSTVHFIGEGYGGGIVFYVYDNGQHGLIAATADQSTSPGIQWYNGINRTTGTTGDGLGAGAMNTAMIVATQMADNQAGNFAAKLCADYSVTIGGVTYGDWYLPSKYELNLLYLQKAVVGGFTNLSYWASSESDEYAYYQYFSNGATGGDLKGNSNRVRAVRAF